MTIDWEAVAHITKVDPAKPLPDAPDILAQTDLVMVGGSDHVTAGNTLDTIERVRSIVPELPVLQEPYAVSHVSTDSLQETDGIAVPAVFNGDREHFRGKHLRFFAKLGASPDELRGADVPLVGRMIRKRGKAAITALTDRIVGEGYVIQNPDARAATETGAETPLSTEDVAGAALATESYYRFPIFYIEYSGTYGGPEDVRAAAPHLEESQLLYGGGISTHEQTMEILDAGADAVVVGDCFHEDSDRYLETIP